MSSPERPPDTIGPRVRALMETSLAHAKPASELCASRPSMMRGGVDRVNWLAWHKANELSAYAMGAARENIAAGFNHLERVMGVRSAKELLAVHEDYRRESSDRFGAQVVAWNDLVAKAAKAIWASL